MITLEELRVIREQRRLTKDEKQSYRYFWQESGLSKVAFCRQEQLSLSTFLSWFQTKKGICEESRPIANSSIGFLPVELKVKHSLENEISAPIKFQLPNGLSIEGRIKVCELKFWLKELNNAITPLC